MNSIYPEILIIYKSKERKDTPIEGKTSYVYSILGVTEFKIKYKENIYLQKFTLSLNESAFLDLKSREKALDFKYNSEVFIIKDEITKQVELFKKNMTIDGSYIKNGITCGFLKKINK